MKKSLLGLSFVVALLSISAGSAHAASVYFWSNGADANWTRVGNWYTDAATTTPLGSVPTYTDDVVTVGTLGPQVNLDTWIQPASIDASSTGISFTSVTHGQTIINITGSTTFNGSSNNQGHITGTTTFNGLSYNQGGGSITGSTTFNGSSYNFGTITGPTTFNGSSNNRGLINGTTTFNGSSYNNGTITGTAIFTNATGGIMTVPDGSQWRGGTATSIVGADLQPITQWIFNGSSHSDNNITGSTTFNGSSYNYGTITGTTTFNGLSCNTGNGTITGPTTFSGSSVNYGSINGTTTFYDLSFNANGTIIGTTFFNGSGSNGGSITGTTTFNSLSANYGTITGTAIFTNASGGIMTVPDGSAWGSGTATSTVGSDLAPITQWIFNGSSANVGTITGSTTFNGSSHNFNATISGTTTFNGDSTENQGTINGTKIRHYNTNLATSRNFINNSPWTVIADGAVVNIANATYDTNPESPGYTTFQTLNGGSFVTTNPSAILINSPTANQTVTSWSPSISWNHTGQGYTYCQYSYGNPNDWAGSNDWGGSNDWTGSYNWNGSSDDWASSNDWGGEVMTGPRLRVRITRGKQLTVMGMALMLPHHLPALGH